MQQTEQFKLALYLGHY